jgi:hypothetical protein
MGMPKPKKKPKPKNKTRSEAQWKDRGIGRISLRLPFTTLRLLDQFARLKKLTRAQFIEQMLDELESQRQSRSAKYRRAADAKERREKEAFQRGVTQREVTRACQVLGLDPPPPGGKVERGQVLAAYRAKAKEYHPDRRKGDRSFERELQEATEAKNTLLEGL